MAALQSHTTTGANQPAMWAAATGLHRREGRRRGDPDGGRVPPPARLPGRAVPRARRPGIEFVEPHGAFYFFFRVDGIREKDPLTGSTFCEQLMKQEGVALVPGGAFARRSLGAAELRGVRHRAGEGLGQDRRIDPSARVRPCRLRPSMNVEARVEPLTGGLPVDRLALGSRDRHPLGRRSRATARAGGSPAPSS